MLPTNLPHPEDRNREEELAEFHRHIVGSVEIVTEFRGDKSKEPKGHRRAEGPDTRS